jgi:hypothetical protein
MDCPTGRSDKDACIMSKTVTKTYETVKKLEAQGKPWLEIQHEVEQAKIKRGGFTPLFVGSDSASYRLRFIPENRPLVTSREFDAEISKIASEHSLKLETRCTGYYLYKDTGKAVGLSQRIRKSLGMTYRTKLLQVLYLDKYGIEVERPDVRGVPEALEEIGTQVYGMTT